MDHVLFFGRNYDEILALLLLDEKRLTGRKILDRQPRAGDVGGL